MSVLNALFIAAVGIAGAFCITRLHKDNQRLGQTITLMRQEMDNRSRDVDFRMDAMSERAARAEGEAVKATKGLADMDMAIRVSQKGMTEGWNSKANELGDAIDAVGKKLDAHITDSAEKKTAKDDTDPATDPAEPVTEPVEAPKAPAKKPAAKKSGKTAAKKPAEG